jgi:hypothetical protein
MGTLGGPKVGFRYLKKINQLDVKKKEDTRS